jgi:ubiquinone/menaquinone biosynthesis C-methylase UbiE
MSESSIELQQRARESGDPYKNSAYFEQAEKVIDFLWKLYIWDAIQDSDFTSTLDFAAGHGRNSKHLLPLADRLTIVDINPECIAACQQRFGQDARVTYIVNDGVSLNGVEDDSISLLYSFDSMVHFDSDVIRAYLPEFFRVLKPGGRAFIHHSNYTENPTGDFRNNPHWRNYMSKSLFAHYASRAGFNVARQQIIDWGLQLDDWWNITEIQYPSMDCFSIIEKPIDAPRRLRQILIGAPVSSAVSSVNAPSAVHAANPLNEGMIGLMRYGYHVMVPLSLRLKLRDARLKLFDS